MRLGPGLISLPPPVSGGRIRHGLETAATSVSADMLSAGYTSLPDEDNYQNVNNCAPPPPPQPSCCGDFFLLPPPSCPGCRSRMQGASLQPQPIRAQRRTRRCGAVLLVYPTIKARNRAYRAVTLCTMGRFTFSC